MTRKELHLKEKSEVLEATIREHLNLIEKTDHPDGMVMAILSYPSDNDNTGRAIISGGSLSTLVKTISSIIKSLQERQDSDELAVMLLAAVIDGTCCNYHLHERMMKAFQLVDELNEDEEPDEESREHTEGLLKSLFPRKH